MYSSYSYLTSATRWGWVVSVMPWPHFTPRERTPGTHWIGGWVGLRAGLDAGARRKILCPCRGSNLNHPIIQPVVRHYTAWATAAPIKENKKLPKHILTICSIVNKSGLMRRKSIINTKHCSTEINFSSILKLSINIPLTG
jgi:hypothetical protein